MNIGYLITVILYFKYTHQFVELVVNNNLCLISIVLMTCIGALGDVYLPPRKVK